MITNRWVARLQLWVCQIDQIIYPCHAKFVTRNTLLRIRSFIDTGIGNWNPSSWKIGIPISNQVSTIAAGVLATEGSSGILLSDSRGRFKNAHEPLNPRALKFSPVNDIHIFQCMGKIICVEFQRYLWNSTQNIFTLHWNIRFYTMLKF